MSETKKIKGLARIHRYYLLSGLYRFLLVNIIKTIIYVVLFVLAAWFIQRYILDVELLFNQVMFKLDTWMMLLIFFVSESLMGIIPPDLFVIWAGEFKYPWIMVTILGLLSTAGGVVAYYIGVGLQNVKWFYKIVYIRWESWFVKMKKWGGIFIVLAAILPIPYSLVCALAGLINFRYKLFLILNLTRIARFYLFAAMLFKAISL